MSKSLLIVEDETELRELIVLIFEAEFDDLEIKEANSGNDAIALLESGFRPQLILSDYTMHNGTGGDLFDYLKVQKIDIPFVLVTGGFLEDYPEFKNFADSSQFKKYIRKPFDEEELLEIARQVLGDGEEFSSSEIQFYSFPFQIVEKYGFYNFNGFMKMPGGKYLQILKEFDFDQKNDEQFQHFKNKGLKEIHIRKEDLKSFLTNIQTALKKRYHIDHLNLEERKIGSMTFEFSKVALDFFNIAEKIYEIVNESLTQLINDVKKEKQVFSSLKSNIDKKDYVQSHSIMCMYLATQVMRKMGLVESSIVRKMVMACLYHDVAFNDQELAKVTNPDSEKLNNDQIKIIAEHIQLAQDYVTKLLKMGEEEVLTIIREHHEKPDGSGFPKGLTGNTINSLSAIFILCHDAILFIFNSGYQLGGLKEYIKGLPTEFQEGVFKKPYQALVELLEED